MAAHGLLINERWVTVPKLNSKKFYILFYIQNVRFFKVKVKWWELEILFYSGMDF